MFVLQAATAAANADAPTSLPDNYRPVAEQLTVGCGADRAQAIANLVWDIDIHKAWLQLVEADSSLAPRVGSPSWQRYWISTYQHTVTLLLRDCR